MSTLIGLVTLLVVLQFVELWVNNRTVEIEEEECWVCEFCGTEIHSTTIEGFVEGLRIHEVAIYCPGDEDDDEKHYA
jgi:YgiT-type zinc finger domain-containing protein